MRHRKRLIVLGMAGLAVIAMAGAIALWWQPGADSKINRENFFQLRDAMALEEVTAILGSPGDYRSGQTESCDRRDAFGYTVETGIGNRIESSDRCVVWDTDSAHVIVSFDGSHRLVGGRLGSMRKSNVSFLENLRWRLKHLRDQWFPERPAASSASLPARSFPK
jgi:hypothetical protein